MKELDLLEGPVRKTILPFSIPTILGMAATQLYTVAVVLSCLLLNRQLLSLFTDDPAVIRCGAMLLAFESWTYLLTAMKHLQEARLRGEMKMGQYLTSSLLPIGLNIACCLILVPRFGFSGFYLSTFVSAPFSLLLAMALVKCSIHFTR